MAQLSDDKGPAVLTIIWTLTAVATIFVAARLLVRLHILRKAGLDDTLIAASMIVTYIYAALITVSVEAGYGKHAAVLSDDQLEKARKFNTAGFAPGLLSFSLPKLAVVALLIRIMNPSRPKTIFLWVLASGSSILSFCCVIFLYTQCTPTRALWVSDLPGAKCTGPAGLVNYSIAVGAISAAVDLYLAVYPATVLARLHMNRKKKIGLTFAMGLGTCACAVAIVKCTRIPALHNTEDATYATADVFIWTNIEANTIIIAACIPTLAPLAELFLGKRALASTDPYHNISNDIARLGFGPSKKSAVELSVHRTLITADDHSQKDILIENGNEPFSIQRRDDVIIEYERSSDGPVDSDRDRSQERHPERDPEPRQWLELRLD